MAPFFLFIGENELTNDVPYSEHEGNEMKDTSPAS